MSLFKCHLGFHLNMNECLSLLLWLSAASNTGIIRGTQKEDPCDDMKGLGMGGRGVLFSTSDSWSQNEMLCLLPQKTAASISDYFIRNTHKMMVYYLASLLMHI